VHPHWYQYISIYICNVTFVLQYDSDQNQNLPWYQSSFHFTRWYNTSHKYIDAIANPITIFVLFILANFYKNSNTNIWLVSHVCWNLYAKTILPYKILDTRPTMVHIEQNLDHFIMVTLSPLWSICGSHKIKIQFICYLVFWPI
jgi:hypothetical protein